MVGGAEGFSWVIDSPAEAGLLGVLGRFGCVALAYPVPCMSSE